MSYHFKTAWHRLAAHMSLFLLCRNYNGHCISVSALIYQVERNIILLPELRLFSFFVLASNSSLSLPSSSLRSQSPALAAQRRRALHSSQAGLPVPHNLDGILFIIVDVVALIIIILLKAIFCSHNSWQHEDTPEMCVSHIHENTHTHCLTYTIPHLGDIPNFGDCEQLESLSKFNLYFVLLSWWHCSFTT